MIVQLEGKRPVIFGTKHFIAENATLVGEVKLHNECSVWYNAVIRGDMDSINIGEQSNVQDGAVLHTDPGIPLNIGRRVTIGHMAMLHGCEIGDNSLIGIQSVILNRAKIGKNTIVAANSTIPEGKSFPDGVLIVGSPGRVVRELNDAEINRLSAAYLAYTSKIDIYSKRKVITSIDAVKESTE